MNNLKYTGESNSPNTLSEIETQIDNINKDVELLYLLTTELEERAKSALSPSYPEEANAKSLRCSISPLGERLEEIHNLLLYRISHLKDLNGRIKL